MPATRPSRSQPRSRRLRHRRARRTRAAAVAPRWRRDPGGAAGARQGDRPADGCHSVFTPVLGKRQLFERSGHLAKFSADMFPPMVVGGDELMLRPANCPHHTLAYGARRHSYRELPIRFNELGAMFRAERSGVLSGLSRVRQISLDDTHVFCRPDQVDDEVARALRVSTTRPGDPRVAGRPRPPVATGGGAGLPGIAGGVAHRRGVVAAHGDRRAGRGPPARRCRRGGGVLRAQAGSPGPRRAWPRRDHRHRPGRRRAAPALDLTVRRRRRIAAARGDGPPRHGRLDGTGRGRAARALPGSAPRVAGPGPGGRPPRRAPSRILPPGPSSTPCWPPACGPVSTSMARWAPACGRAGRGTSRHRRHRRQGGGCCTVQVRDVGRGIERTVAGAELVGMLRAAHGGRCDVVWPAPPDVAGS